MTRQGGRLNLVVQFASLATTGVLLWLGAPSFRSWRVALPLVVAQAFLFAVVAWVWSAAIAFLLYLTVPLDDRESTLPQALRTSAVAVWFAPAMILLTNFSPATVPASLALVVTATRLLYSEWRSIHPAAEPALTAPPGLLFGDYLAPAPLFRREFLTALTVSLALQLAATARLFRHPLAAGALLAMTAASLTLFAMTSGVLPQERPRSLPQTLLGILLTIFLAAGLTVGGLRVRGFHGSGDSSGSAPQSSIPTKTVSGGAAAPLRPIPSALGTFPGVILRPDPKPYARLVEPPPVRKGIGISLPRTYAIPFDGEYWMYRFLYQRPPASSLQEHGSPDHLSFSTVDRWPLLMEAHQKLDQPLDLSCRAVRVDIWNADPHSGTMSLELDALGNKGWTTIGIEPVRSVPAQEGGQVVAAPETLEFPLHSPVHDCMELKVVFVRDPSRMPHSAMIAIDRFVLVP